MKQAIHTENQVQFFRLLSLRSALKLEILGMKRRGQSAYSILKKELGLKGNKEKVLEQVQEIIKTAKEAILKKG
jgi:hypothetical protein